MQVAGNRVSIPKLETECKLEQNLAIERILSVHIASTWEELGLGVLGHQGYIKNGEASARRRRRHL